VTEEVAGVGPPARLGLDGGRGVATEPPRRGEDVGASLDERHHVGRVGGLEIPVTPERDDLEARRADEGRQAADDPQVVDPAVDHLVHARLQGVEGADRHGRRRIVAVEDREPAAGSHDPVRLGQDPRRLGDVTEHRVGHHHVERLVGEGQRARIRLLEREVRDVPRQLGGPRDEHR
jgi:hypothetical protein